MFYHGYTSYGVKKSFVCVETRDELIVQFLCTKCHQSGCGVLINIFLFCLSLILVLVVYVAVFLKLIKINAKLREAQRELLWLKRRRHLFEGMPKDYAADTLNADWNKV